MDGSEYLLTTAEVAVALAGFSALIIVLRQSRSTGIPSGLVASLIERSLVATLLSFLPLLLGGLGVPERVLWSGASGLLAIYIASLAYRGVVNRRSEPALAALVSSPLYGASYALGLAVMLLQFANALGIGVQQGVWWYLTGLTWLLGSVCLVFFVAVRAWARAV